MRPLYVDCDVLASPASGVAVYLREVLAGLSGEVVRRPEHAAVGAPQRSWLRKVPGAYALRAWRQAWPLVPREAIFWSPNFLLPPLSPARSVVTVHDTIFWDTPQWADPVRGAFFRRHLPGTLRRASRVIVPSHAGAERLRELEPRAHISVIPWGVRMLAVRPAERRSVLYFGNIEPRKDVETLVRAYARLPAAVRAAHPLVVAGHASDARYADSLGVTITKRPSDAVLAQLVAEAAVVVSPSRAEGLGLTPLEALVAGAPVVVSDIAIARDVLGDAADYFPVGDAEALCVLLAARLREPRSPSAAVRAALAERFSWAACAQAHAELFASLA